MTHHNHENQKRNSAGANGRLAMIGIMQLSQLRLDRANHTRYLVMLPAVRKNTAGQMKIATDTTSTKITGADCKTKKTARKKE